MLPSYLGHPSSHPPIRVPSEEALKTEEGSIAVQLLRSPAVDAPSRRRPRSAILFFAPARFSLGFSRTSLASGREPLFPALAQLGFLGILLLPLAQLLQASP